MPQLEHIDAIERRLWSAADTLRANSQYASNEYFLPVMELVFLHSHVHQLLSQNDTLKRARDLLLPRLMNGEIAV